MIQILNIEKLSLLADLEQICLAVVLRSRKVDGTETESVPTSRILLHNTWGKKNKDNYE